MIIAVEGCSHGELDIIYNAVAKLEELNGFKVDCLLCCGDFQAVRNEQDLKCMAVPSTYMAMQDFYQYYSGEKKAPVLTIFIGGNHEASNHLQEFPYGGWVAPNIYFIGKAGVIEYGGLCIGGLSGIYKGPDYLKGHYEKSPYTSDSVRSVYHVRNLEVFRLKQISRQVDIFLSHDWPRKMYNHGDKAKLMKLKKHFVPDIKSDTLGSRPAEELLKKIKPSYWFSGHLHVKFPALIKHEDGTNGKSVKVTRFLALDKCLPNRNFLQIVEVPHNRDVPLELKYDAEWLTILRLTNHLLSVSNTTVFMPGPGGSERYQFTPTESEIKATVDMMGGSLVIPNNFRITAPPFRGRRRLQMDAVSMPNSVLNPQTVELCNALCIDDPISLLISGSQKPMRPAIALNDSEMNITLETSKISCNPDEVDISDDDVIDDSSDILFGMELLEPVDTDKNVTDDTDKKVADDADQIVSETVTGSQGESASSLLDTSDTSRRRGLRLSSPKGHGADLVPAAESSKPPPPTAILLKRDSDMFVSDEPVESVIGGKKIRRRNLSLYASSDDISD